jgi:hypothetical protein
MAIEKLKKPYLGKLRYAQELGVKVDEVINTVNEFTDGSVTANEINETTSGSGVTVDSALIKDGSFIGKQATATVTVDGLTTGFGSQTFFLLGVLTGVLGLIIGSLISGVTSNIFKFSISLNLLIISKTTMSLSFDCGLFEPILVLALASSLIGYFTPSIFHCIP